MVSRVLPNAFMSIYEFSRTFSSWFTSFPDSFHVNFYWWRIIPFFGNETNKQENKKLWKSICNLRCQYPHDWKHHHFPSNMTALQIDHRFLYISSVLLSHLFKSACDEVSRHVHSRYFEITLRLLLLYALLFASRFTGVISTFELDNMLEIKRCCHRHSCLPIASRRIMEYQVCGENNVAFTLVCLWWRPTLERMICHCPSFEFPLTLDCRRKAFASVNVF